MDKDDCIGTAYQPIGGGYAYASLRVGLTVINPQGRSIYIQPGDDEAAMRANIEALDEVSLDPEDGGRSILADMLLYDYFTGGDE